MSDTNTLSWEIQFPLLTNPLVTGAWFKAMGATYLLCMLRSCAGPSGAGADAGYDGCG